MMNAAPDDILREVRDLHRFILALIASPDTTRWHWPSYYLLYVDMDRMAWRLRRTRTVFADEPLCDTEAGAVDDAFADLGKVQGSIVDRLWHIARNTLTVIEDKRLRQQLRAHLHPKSEWYQVFRSGYCPGRVSADGTTLERSILTIDPEPPERIHDLDAKQLHVRQSFDIGTDAARTLLACALGKVEQEHAAVTRAMADFFLAHCAIEQLLHPTSV